MKTELCLNEGSMDSINTFFSDNNFDVELEKFKENILNYNSLLKKAQVMFDYTLLNKKKEKEKEKEISENQGKIEEIPIKENKNEENRFSLKMHNLIHKISEKFPRLSFLLNEKNDVNVSLHGVCIFYKKFQVYVKIPQLGRIYGGTYLSKLKAGFVNDIISIKYELSLNFKYSQEEIDFIKSISNISVESKRFK